MGRQIFWTAIVTIPFAIVQAIIAWVTLFMFLYTAIGVGSYVSRVSSAVDVVTLNSVTGLNIGSSITSRFALMMTIIGLIVVSLVVLSTKLCEGICQNKPGNIIVYVVFGGIVAIIRMSTLTKDNFRSFPEDKTVLYLSLYTLYLILLVVHVVKIKRAREQGEIALQAALMGYAMAASAPSRTPTAPPTYKDANECHALV